MLNIERKIDVMIPTRNEANIRPKLMNVLNKADWVRDIIIETSKPLSTARKTGALKCQTEWLAMFDDDVEIPEEWLYGMLLYRRYISPKTLAISSPSLNANIPHYLAFQKISNRLVGLRNLKTPFVDNTLIKRSVFENYNPEPCFYAEDELLHNYVLSIGEWRHTDYIGVKHYYNDKDSYHGGFTEQHYNLTPFWRLCIRMLERSILPVLAVHYSHSFKTVPYWYKKNQRELIGYIRGKLGCAYDERVYKKKYSKNKA